MKECWAALCAMTTVMVGCGASMQVEEVISLSALPAHEGRVTLLVPGQVDHEGELVAELEASGPFGAGRIDHLMPELQRRAGELGANTLIIDEVRATIISTETTDEVPCDPTFSGLLARAITPPEFGDGMCTRISAPYDAGYSVIVRARATRRAAGES